MKGFSLLEILVTMVIFATGVSAVIWAISSGTAATVSIEGMDLALNIAQSSMEDIKNKNFATIVSEGDYGPTPDANFPDYSVTVDIASGDDPMQVEVTVTWDVKGGETSVSLATLVTSTS